jgi:hypothetical protein
MKGLYKVTRNLLNSHEVEKITECVRNDLNVTFDSQVPNSVGYYNISICNIILGVLCSRISKLTGKKLLPTCSYCRIYKNGNILDPHVDRPSCEYSVTINLFQTHKWNIYMGEKALDLQPGDGCIYRGCEIEHSRREFTGDEYIQLFLHYVDSNGKYKDCIYDIENQKIVNYRPHYNSNTMNYFNIQHAFTSDDCDLISKRDFQQHQVYDKIIKYVDEINSIYKFDISTIENACIVNHDYEHFDDWNDVKSRRKLTILIQFDDEVNIIFGDGTNLETAKGSMIIFPGYFKYKVSGTVLRAWATGTPFR